MTQISIASFEAELREAQLAGDNDRVAEVTQAYNKERVKRGGYAAIGAPEEDARREEAAAKRKESKPAKSKPAKSSSNGNGGDSK